MSQHVTRRQLLKAAGAIAIAAGVWPRALNATTRARKPKFGPWGFDLSGMDRSVKPGDDFFSYAGGTWVSNTEIPADRQRWGTFNILRDQAEFDTRDVIEQAAGDSPPEGSVARKVVDYYQSYVDTAQIDKLGLTPVKADLARIASARTHEDMVAFATAADIRAALPLRITVTLDAKRPDTYVMGIRQSGLGMPDRKYYLGKDPRLAETREQYQGYIDTLLSLANYPDPPGNARAIFDLEHRIARLHWPRSKSRNRDLTYNPKTAKQLKALAPEYPWKTALETFGTPDQDFFVVSQPDAAQGLAKLFRQTPVDTWRAYLTFHYLNALSDILPKDIDDAHFNFFGRVVSGVLEQKDRWVRAVDDMNSSLLNEAVGQLYVKDHFRPEDKAAGEQLVANLTRAYKTRISKLPWMSTETKDAALEKLDKMHVKIGYPDKWRDYSTLEVVRGDAIGNRRRLHVFSRQRDLKRLSGPADRSEWYMGPQTVNAYHQSAWNEIVFPAAILQPPFFDVAADDAVNYGGIGAVIGHEMGHGFDDQGAKTNADGILKNWWTKQDKARFTELTRALATQYSAFEPLPGMHIDGELTLGENIGDLGGLNVSLEAYRISLDGHEPPVLDGFTGIQRYFLGFSQIWRVKTRPDALRRQLIVDPHSPGKYRTNGTVRNMDAWYTVFHVRQDDKLYLAADQRIRIW